VVDASCRAATAASASRAAVEACSSSKTRAMAHTWAGASTTFFSVSWRATILSVTRCCRATAASATASLAASSTAIERAGEVETGDTEERSGGGDPWSSA
jgi:hypothetical protein